MTQEEYQESKGQGYDDYAASQDLLKQINKKLRTRYKNDAAVQEKNDKWVAQQNTQEQNVEAANFTQVAYIKF